MKPDWSDSPKWAQYLAQDEDGSWNWYSKKPTLKTDQWWPNGHVYQSCVVVDNWRDTLEERPIRKEEND
jgi:hypothetical protein